MTCRRLSVTERRYHAPITYRNSLSANNFFSNDPKVRAKVREVVQSRSGFLAIALPAFDPPNAPTLLPLLRRELRDNPRSSDFRTLLGTLTGRFPEHAEPDLKEFLRQGNVDRFVNVSSLLSGHSLAIPVLARHLDRTTSGRYRG